MKTVMKIFLANLLVLGLSAGIAYADHGKGMFDRADKDGNGVVSKAEFMSAAEARFNMIDANNDGQITREESKAHREAMKAKWKERKGERANERKGERQKMPENQRAR